MDIDRKEVYKIINETLVEMGSDNIEECFDRLEKYISKCRMETIGWTVSEMCSLLDQGDDIRDISIPYIIKRYKEDNS